MGEAWVRLSERGDAFSEVGLGWVCGQGSSGAGHSPTDGAEQRDGVAVRSDQSHL